MYSVIDFIIFTLLLLRNTGIKFSIRTCRGTKDVRHFRNEVELDIPVMNIPRIAHFSLCKIRRDSVKIGSYTESEKTRKANEGHSCNEIVD